jgi:tripartite-type tricarboxylate transporter receptor subunit TctC
MKTVAIVFLMFFTSFCLLDFSMAAEPSYPTKPIEMFVGFSPGAGTDLGARMIAEHAKKPLGQEVVVVNKPGGGGRVALTLMSKAKPDGYTLAATTDSAVILSPHLEKFPYKP